MARPDFRGQAARRLAEERDMSPAIISLLSPDAKDKPHGVRNVKLDHITPNPNQPRMTFDEEALNELAASIREHGVLQPILVRPTPDPQHFQLVAGERRWRAAQKAELTEIPALIEEIDDDTALEIAIIENLQREDFSPLEEALMYERMTREHGYSVRRLAQKIGKDKGYIENRLRLADAPTEIKQLVSLRKDTLSHAYELLKVEDPRKRRKLAEQVASGELSLVKLRERIEGRTRHPRPEREVDPEIAEVGLEEQADDEFGFDPAPLTNPPTEDSLVNAKQSLAEALDEIASVLTSREVLAEIGDIDRANLAKYLTIAKIRLENVIAVVRPGEGARR